MSVIKGFFLSKKGIIITTTSLVLIAVVAYAISHFKGNNQIDRSFSKYIESYTAGIISRESSVRIRLVSRVEGTHAQNEELPDGIFSFSPSVKGKAYWIDALTVEFKPEKPLDPDKKYNATFKLGKVTNVDDEHKEFDFCFQTIAPDFTVVFNGLQTSPRTSLDKMKLEGVVQTADAESN